MKTRAAVLAGKQDIYIREFELPPIGEEELLVKVISNSVCLSTYKAALQGPEHKRVPPDIAEHPAITGHHRTGRQCVDRSLPQGRKVRAPTRYGSGIRLFGWVQL